MLGTVVRMSKTHERGRIPRQAIGNSWIRPGDASVIRARTPFRICRECRAIGATIATITVAITPTGIGIVSSATARA